MADVELPPGLANLLGTATIAPEQLAEQLYDSPMAPAEEAVLEAVFQLNEIERDSQLWQKIDGMLLRLLQIYRQSNDLPQDAVATARIRGKIEMIKEFRRIGEPPPADDDPDAPDLGY
jgi:hypothetical protein